MEESQSSYKSIDVTIFEKTQLPIVITICYQDFSFTMSSLQAAPPLSFVNYYHPNFPGSLPDTSDPTVDKTEAQTKTPAISHMNTDNNAFFISTLHRRRSRVPRPGDPGRG